MYREALLENHLKKIDLNVTQYPKLANKSSDGAFNYLVLRRLSAHITSFCLQRGISANSATIIDFILALFAALSLYMGYLFTGVTLIQLFGVWSCVDGEIARVTKSTSRLGDFYDTMIDRVAEYLITLALLLHMYKVAPDVHWGTIFFAYMGTIFFITASSEKFRSVFHKNYPKNDTELFFRWLCAGSDTRLFYISLGIIGYAISGYDTIIYWLIILQTVFLAFNFIFRLWKIPKLIKSAKDFPE